MAGKTRDVRVEQQELDNGKPDDEVLITNSPSGEHYHNSEECRTIQDSADMKTTTRKDAQLKWLGPCEHCIID